MKLGYTIVYVPAVTAALEFYEAAFGLERRFLHESGDYGELETGATALAFASEALAKMNGVKTRPNRAFDESAPAIEIALVTSDVPAAHERAVKAGAREVVAPNEKPWGQVVSYVRDLNGVLVELCTPIGG